MKRPPTVLVRALAAVMASQAGFVFAGATVEQTVVGPAANDVVYVVSPAGGRVAAGVTRGSRFAVAVDGVDGPTFDSVMNVTSAAAVVSPPDPATLKPGYQPKPVFQTPVVFSDDGRRYAYVARDKQEYVVMVDGKESFRLPAHQGVQVRMQFTGPTGARHLLSVAGITNLFDVYVDGQKLPAHEPNEVPVVSRDGRRVAYVGTPDAADRAKKAIVIDGTIADTAGDTPMFTADGRHVLALQRGGTTPTLLLDGKPAVTSATGIERVYLAPAGDKFVTVVMKPGPGGAHYVCVADGKEVAATEGTAPPFVVFSPDGKRWAARCRNITGTPVNWLATDDGKKGPDYQGIADDSIVFNADASRLAYVAGSGSKSFVVVDGKESEGFSVGAKVGFSPDGRRVYYGGTQQTGQLPTRLLVVEDKTVRGDHNFKYESIAFSDDGSRWAALGSGLKTGGPNGLQAVANLVVDGDIVPGFTVGTFVLSPDGKHVAFYGQRHGDGVNGLFLDDGRPLKLNVGTRGRLAKFSADGKHLFWTSLETDKASGRPVHVAYVDGHAFARFDNVALGNFETDPGAWRANADGTLSAVGAVGDKVIAYRVTPDAAMTVATAAAEFAASEAKATVDAAAARQAAADAVARQKADAAAAAQQRQADAAAAREKAIADRNAAAAEKKRLRDEAAAAKKAKAQGN